MPAPKKIADIASTVITYLVIAAGITYLFITEGNGVNIVVISSCLRLLTGLAGGFVFSYKIFRTKGWDKTRRFMEESESY